MELAGLNCRKVVVQQHHCKERALYVIIPFTAWRPPTLISARILRHLRSHSTS
jgi:hypothetical protein